MSDYRQFARRLGLGRLLYRCIYRPLEKAALIRDHGLPLVCRSAWGDRSMRHATRSLPAPAAASRPPLPVPVCFLTGRRFVHQTLFCLHSLATHAGPVTAPEILSDGSLAEEDARAIRRLWPDAVVRHAHELDDAVAAALPPERFPVLHAVRREFVLLRKLTDSMAGRSGFRVLLDSDMLFWSRPAELLERFATRAPFYLHDISDDGYTVPRAELERRFGIRVAAGVNSGLVGLDASLLDWDLLERVCDHLRSASGDRRLLEQTLWAVALGAVGARSLDPSAYAVAIDPPGCWTAIRTVPPPALLHYAWHARLPYSAGEWRRYLAASGT